MNSQLVLSPSARWIRPSPTIEMNDLVIKLRKEGHSIINLGIGEMVPEIPTPQLMKDGMNKAVDEDKYGYNSSAGCGELLEALQEDLKINFGLNYEKDQLLVCPGPKDAITKVVSALIHHSCPRNDTITWAPIFESYTNVPGFFSGKETIILDTDEHLNPDLDQLERFLEKNNETVALAIINSPNNPTGQVYSEEKLKKMAEIFGKYPQIAIISDEVYRTMVYDVKHHSIATYLPYQTIVVGGISKEISGTGLRLGWIAGPSHVTKAINTINGNFTSCCNLPVQLAYTNLLKQDKDMSIRNSVRDQVAVRRKVILEKMHSLEGFKDFQFEDPQGAFYMFPKVTKLFGRKTPEGKVIETDTDLAVYLLESSGVATIPGSKFHKAGYIRMAYACSSPSLLEEAMNKLSEALLQLKE